jgi:hypothetical protein
MPAGSDPRPRPDRSGAPGDGSSAPTDASLPVTFRPLGVRIAVVVLGVLLLAVVAVIWLAFPQSVRDQFTTFQRLTLVAFGLAALAAGYALARSRVEAREDGLLLVNGYRARLHPWGDVAKVSLRPGAPWATVDLADGETAAAMGIQGSDGRRAVAQVGRLRAILAGHAGRRPGAESGGE